MQWAFQHVRMQHQDIQAGILTALAYKFQNNDKQMAFDVEIQRHLTMLYVLVVYSAYVMSSTTHH